jgi:integrase
MSVRYREWIDRHGKPQGAWVIDVKWPGGPRVQKASPVNTRRGAEQYEREVRAALLAGTWGKVTCEVPKFSKFVERYLEHSATENKSSTIKAKRDILRCHLEPAFGGLFLDAVGTRELDAFKAQLLKKVSKKTVNNVLTVLHNILATAKEWGELHELPKLTWLKAPKPAFDFLTFAEAEQLVQGCEAGRWGTMVVLVLNAGLRIGEVCGLRWEDVDMRAGRLMVRRRVWRGTLDTPKGGREREVPLNEKALAALQAWPRQLHIPWVFPQRDGGFIRNPQHAPADAILRQAERAGLRPIGWHTLRHTFASHLVMKGVSLKAVQELLGHADISMTMRYAHLAPEVKKDAVRMLDEPVTHEGDIRATRTVGDP